jgi:hypothetical protein
MCCLRTAQALAQRACYVRYFESMVFEGIHCECDAAHTCTDQLLLHVLAALCENSMCVIAVKLWKSHYFVPRQWGLRGQLPKPRNLFVSVVRTGRPGWSRKLVVSISTASNMATLCVCCNAAEKSIRVCLYEVRLFNYTIRSECLVPSTYNPQVPAPNCMWRSPWVVRTSTHNLFGGGFGKPTIRDDERCPCLKMSRPPQQQSSLADWGIRLQPTARMPAPPWCGDPRSLTNSDR